MCGLLLLWAESAILMQDYTDKRLETLVGDSTQIEGIALGGEEYYQHLISARLVRTAGECGQLLHPRVVHQALSDYDGFGRMENPGEYRKCAVRVGACVPPKWEEVEGKMKEWWDDVSHHPNSGTPFYHHAWFESIHPFIDGNGRTGRLLMWNMEILLNLPLTHIQASARHNYYGELEAWRKEHGW